MTAGRSANWKVRAAPIELTEYLSALALWCWRGDRFHDVREYVPNAGPKDGRQDYEYNQQAQAAQDNQNDDDDQDGDPGAFLLRRWLAGG